MYIPNKYLTTDPDEIVGLMKQLSFATMVTTPDDLPSATHLPFVVSTKEDEIILTSHIAKANPQSAEINNNTVLVIFSGPNAYISPTHYETEQNVPTWNYIAVHAYGKGKLIRDTDKLFESLETMMDHYESAYKEQWDELPEDYKRGLAQRIYAFKIRITDLQAKKKLSQNRTKSEQQNIIDTLSESHDTNEQLIAEFMKKDDAANQ